MRLVLLLTIAFAANLHAAEIRVFKLDTIAALGRALYQHRHEKLDPAQTHALETAQAALPKLDRRRYEFEVLRDPTGAGFLVYALAISSNAQDIVLGLHYRVTVNADGAKATAVDALGRNPIVLNNRSSPRGTTPVAFWAISLVSSTPLETHVYETMLHRIRLILGGRDGSHWMIDNGKISRLPPTRR